MAIDKGVFEWQGFPGAPGYSVFYATPDMGVSGLIKTFFSSIASILPNNVLIACPTVGDRLDEATGLLTGTWSGGVGGSVPGTYSGVYPGPAGAAITWETAGIARGRRVRGRTFIVPIVGDAFQNDGSLGAGALATLQTAADTLVSGAAGDLLVWSRPRLGAGGSAHPIVSARVSDRVAVLRSRRG